MKFKVGDRVRVNRRTPVGVGRGYRRDGTERRIGHVLTIVAVEPALVHGHALYYVGTKNNRDGGRSDRPYFSWQLDPYDGKRKAGRPSGSKTRRRALPKAHLLTTGA